MLYCIVLHCALLIVLCCVLLHLVFDCILMDRMLLHCAVSIKCCCIVFCFIVLSKYCAVYRVLCCIVLCCVELCCVELCCVTACCNTELLCTNIYHKWDLH